MGFEISHAIIIIDLKWQVLVSVLTRQFQL